MTIMTTSKDELNASNYIKKNQRLPENVQEFFKNNPSTHARNALIKSLCDNGWTFEAVSSSTTLTRERVRQIAKQTSADDIIGVEFGFETPTPPLKPEKPKREFIEPHPDTLKRLLELQPYAQQVRSNGAKYREEAEEYTRLLNHAHMVEGVTLYRLAKRLGVTHGALRFRLVRYGYKKPVSATSKVYTPIKQDNRIADK